jgi:uncharacterized protein (UPF0332 family)
MTNSLWEIGKKSKQSQKKLKQKKNIFENKSFRKVFSCIYLSTNIITDF